MHGMINNSDPFGPLNLNSNSMKISHSGLLIVYIKAKNKKTKYLHKTFNILINKAFLKCYNLLNIGRGNGATFYVVTDGAAISTHIELKLNIRPILSG